MVIIMDASTGKIENLESYGDEVLNAGWLPRPSLGLQLQPAVSAKPRPPRPITDPEQFLATVYRNQS